MGWGFELPDLYWGLENLLPQLDKLNAVEPIPPRKSPNGLPEIPLPSSGNGFADLLADLSGTYGVEGALALMKVASADQLNKVVFRANERQRPEEERRKEAMEAAHKQWLKDNQQLVSETMGLPEGFGLPFDI